MAKIFVNNQVYENFKIGVGKVRMKTYVNDPKPFRWPKGWFGLKTAKKANFAPKNWEQRSIAKVSYAKNIYPGQWRIQGKYLARQGAQLADQRGLGFSEKDDDLNIAKTLASWQENGDPRLWKVILSPEMAHKLDLKEHVRAVMGQVEKDLSAKLEWVAIDHYNTDNPHAHIVIRGIDREGQELQIKKEYFTQGFRLRSQQEATRKLGFRIEQDVLLKREHNIKSLHITELDREIGRKLTKDCFINLTAEFKSSFANEKQLQLKSRLMFLESMGLAKKYDSVAWYVEPGFLDCLKHIQTQHDIVKTKNKHIHSISNPNLPVVVNKLEHVGDKLVGRIIGAGFDEFRNDSRYMLIEGTDNKIHYVPASLGISKRRDGGDLRNGDIVCLERKDFVSEKEGHKRVKYLAVEGFYCWEEFEYARRLNRGYRGRGLRLSLTREDT